MCYDHDDDTCSESIYVPASKGSSCPITICLVSSSIGLFTARKDDITVLVCTHYDKYIEKIQVTNAKVQLYKR